MKKCTRLLAVVSMFYLSAATAWADGGSDGVEFQVIPVPITENCSANILRGTERFANAAFVMPQGFLATDESGQPLLEILPKGTGFLLRMGIRFPRDNEQVVIRQGGQEVRVKSCDFDAIHRYLQRDSKQQVSIAQLPLKSIEFSLEGVKSKFRLGSDKTDILNYQGTDQIVELSLDQAELDEVLRKLRGSIGLPLTMNLAFAAKSSDGYISIKLDGNQIANEVSASLGANINAKAVILAPQLQSIIKSAIEHSNVSGYIEAGSDSEFDTLARDIVRGIIATVTTIPNNGKNGTRDGNNNGGWGSWGGNNGNTGSGNWNGSDWGNTGWGGTTWENWGGNRNNNDTDTDNTTNGWGNWTGGNDPWGGNTGGNTGGGTGNGGGTGPGPGPNPNPSPRPSPVPIPQGNGSVPAVNVQAAINYLRSQKSITTTIQRMSKLMDHVYSTSTTIHAAVTDPSVSQFRLRSGEEAKIILTAAKSGTELSFVPVSKSEERYSYQTTARYFTRDEFLSARQELEQSFPVLKSIGNKSVQEYDAAGAKRAFVQIGLQGSFLFGREEQHQVFLGGNKVEIDPSRSDLLPISVAFSKSGRTFKFSDIMRSSTCWESTYNDVLGLYTFKPKCDLGVMFFTNDEQPGGVQNVIASRTFQEQRGVFSQNVRSRNYSREVAVATPTVFTTYTFNVILSDTGTGPQTIKLDETGKNNIFQPLMNNRTMP